MQKTVTTVTCDLGAGCPGEARAITLALGGDAREVDVCAGHEAALLAELAPFIAAARPARRAVSSYRSAASRGRSAAIRAWAREQGRYGVGADGRLPAVAVDDYLAAHQ